MSDKITDAGEGSVEAKDGKAGGAEIPNQEEISDNIAATTAEAIENYSQNTLVETSEKLSMVEGGEADRLMIKPAGLDVTESEEPVYYVGIGASAGGLEALQQLFDNLPAFTGAGYIVVQHLSPDFKSMMQHLLSANTAMPVITVEDGIHVKRNCVYLIPPRKNMILAEGRLRLTDQVAGGGIKAPINLLFKSLADDQQHRVVGVILSGTGSDGAKGITAIKEASGFVITQTPETAKFDGMPQNANATGVVDLSLPPADIASRIAALCKKPQLLHSSLANATPKAHEAVMRDIFNQLKTLCNTDYTQYKHSTIARRIERRMQVHQIETIEQYRDLLQDRPSEVKVLAKELLIGVTRFFRDEETFAYLKNHAVDQLLDNRASGEALRVWVAGCSSGEEAYSIAMTIDQVVNQRDGHREIKIFATDIDEEAIIRAGNGRYSADAVQDIPEQYLEIYFTLGADGSYCANKRLRQMIIFARHNMITDPPFSNLDLISCRNTLIYFQYLAQRRVLSSFHFALKKQGLLLLGSSESLGELQPHFDPLNERYKYFIKNSKSLLSVSQLPQRDPNGLRTTTMQPVDFALKAHRGVDRSSPFSFVKDRMIEKFIHTVFILNERFEILHSYGASEFYLRPLPKGQINVTLVNMVQEPLKIPISTALHRAQAEKCEVCYSDILIGSTDANDPEESDIAVDIYTAYHAEHEVNGADVFYSIVITPTLSALRDEGFACLEAQESGEEGGVGGVSGDAEGGTGVSGVESTVDSVSASKISRAMDRRTVSDLARQRIKDLEEALAHNQEHLLVTVEELETTNEELQSTNEELMSANEELQSTNEELQSVNEELYTVNTEYQQKIHELTEVNDDLKNVLGASQFGVLFLDRELNLRKYTQVATNHFKLIGQDIGRPIAQIGHHLEYDRIEQDIATVQKSGRMHESTVKNTLTQREVLVRIVPYATNHGVHWNGDSRPLILVLTTDM